MPVLRTDHIPTPVGPLFLALEGHEVVFLDFADNQGRIQRLLSRRYGSYTLLPEPDPEGISSRIERYFAGELSALGGIPYSTGGTAFQQAVWQGLLEVPVGQTWSYGQLAAHLGHPQAVRAVGQTNGLNPVALILPCHRVIGKGGRLTGYAGGLERKQWLLEHEGRLPPAPQALFAVSKAPVL